jgi:hypothetical protein
MNIPSFRVVALGFAFGSVAHAQSPAAPPPPATASIPATPGVSPQPFVTESSRVRAFNAGPDGEIRSLYIQNGSIVDVTPALGGQLGPAIRKGEKITVTRTKSEVNGQSLVEAASVRFNDQTFSANAPSALLLGPGALVEGAAPPPGAPQAPPPARSPRQRSKPCGVSADAPPPPLDFGGPPPPPPDGMAPPPPPPDGIGPPPPPPPPQD